MVVPVIIMEVVEVVAVVVANNQSPKSFSTSAALSCAGFLFNPTP